MKKWIFTLCFWVYIALILMGQTSSQFIIDKELFNMNDEFEQRISGESNIDNFIEEILSGSSKASQSFYLEEEQKDSTLYYGWDVNSSSWFLREKDAYFYNSALLQNQVIRYKRDNTDNSWIPSARTDIQYDQSGNESDRTRYSWNGGQSVWGYSSRSVYNYNEQNNLVLSVEYLWDMPNMIWVPRSRLKNDYDADQNKIQQLFSLWDPVSDQFVFVSRTNTEYHPEFNEQWITDSEWNAALSDWIPKIRQVRKQDDEGNLSSLITGSWNQLLNEWNYYRKVEYSYDGSGNLDLMTEYLWNETSQAWDFPSLITIELNFDDLGNVTSYTSYTKEYGATFWTAGYRYLYVYDENNRLTEYASLRWRENQQQWEGLNRLVHFYGSGQVGAKETVAPTHGIVFFPNPVKDILYFRAQFESQYRITDLSGKTLLVTSSANEIDVKHLAPGAYLLQIQTGNGVSIHRIVKL